METIDSATSMRGSRIRDRAAWILLLLVIAATLWVRLRLDDLPLERDEGEYAFAGSLLLDGVPPYARAYNMKLPGIYLAYAIVEAVFGSSLEAIRHGLMIVNGLSIVLLFLLGRRLLGAGLGLAAASVFGLLTLGTPMQGLFANAEHFVLLPALAGLWLLIRIPSAGRARAFLVPGLLLGLAFITKQHGIAFVLLGIVVALIAPAAKGSASGGSGPARRIARAGVLALGAALPFGAICAVLALCGVFDRFWFWTFTYASEYATGKTISEGLAMLGPKAAAVVLPLWALWGLAALGLLTLATRNRTLRGARLFILMLLVFSVLAVIPGFHFRYHYFLFLTPAAGLLSAAALAALPALLPRKVPGLLRRGAPWVLLLAALGQGVYADRMAFFVSSGLEVCRAVYSINPFPEAIEIARYLREHSAEDDAVAVIGSEPEIYYYAGRPAATGYIYTYGLMEDHPHARTMQDEMIREIEAADPRFLVYVNVPFSWARTPRSPTRIFEWFRDYSTAGYRRTVLAEILTLSDTLYHWDGGPEGPLSEEALWIAVYERN